MSGAGLGFGTSSPATVTVNLPATPAVARTRSRNARCALDATAIGMPASLSASTSATAPGRGSMSWRASSITSACSSFISVSPRPGWPSITSSLPAAIECDEPMRSRLCSKVKTAPWRRNRSVSARVQASSVSSRRPSLSNTTAAGTGSEVTTPGYLKGDSPPLGGLAPEEPDRRALGQHEAVDDVEAVAAVEGQVGLLAGLQVGGQALAVAELQARADQRRPDALALGAGVDAEHREVEVALGRVADLDLPEPAQDAGQPRQHARQRERQQAQRLAARLAPAVGQRPQRRAGVALGGGPADVLGRQAAQLPGEEAPRPLRPRRTRRVDPARDRVVVERARQHRGQRVDVLLAHRADRHPPGLYAARRRALRLAVRVDLGDELAEDALGVGVGNLAGAGRAVAAAAVLEHELADVGLGAAVQDRLARREDRVLLPQAPQDV